MNEEQKEAFDKLKDLIKNSSPSGVHGGRVVEIQEALAAFEKTFEAEAE